MDEQKLAQLSSAAPWRGNAFDTNQVAQDVLAAWCTRAGLVTAIPNRRVSTPDAIVTDPDQNWMVPVVVNGVARDEFTISRRLLDTPVAILWVFLGAHDGGPASRTHTRIVVLDPATAWELPATIGEDVPADRPSYQWVSIPAALQDELTDHTAGSPDELRALLERHAWPRPGLPATATS